MNIQKEIKAKEKYISANKQSKTHGILNDTGKIKMEHTLIQSR